MLEARKTAKWHGIPWTEGYSSGKSVFGELVPESREFHVRNSRGKSFITFGVVQGLLQKLPFGMLDSGFEILTLIQR